MLHKLLARHGRSALEVAWPSHQGRLGTCDFMTKTCAVECKIGQSKPDIQSYLFFLNNDVSLIIDEMLKQYYEDNATCISWWCESGDCPEKLTKKVFSIIEILCNQKIPQSGFTRNKKLWELINKLNGVNIALTVENKTEAVELSKQGIVSVPNYNTWKVKIFVYDDIILCGGGSTCGTGTVDEPGYIQEEDCSLCHKNKRGCYTEAA